MELHLRLTAVPQQTGHRRPAPALAFHNLSLLLFASRVSEAAFLPPDNWTASSRAISPPVEGGELRRGQPVLGHLVGGRACLLAMRVSRSVLLSVCEAVIRFQDFPSVTGRLAKLHAPPHEGNHRDVTPSSPGPLHLSRQGPQPPAATPGTSSAKRKKPRSGPHFCLGRER